MDFLLGQVILLPYDFVPVGWLECNGQLLQIQQFTALFALIGAQFGGDGKTTFALPKLAPVKADHGASLKYYIAVQGIFPTRD